MSPERAPLARSGPDRSAPVTNSSAASLTNEALLSALSELPTEQRECLVMRFL